MKASATYKIRASQGNTLGATVAFIGIFVAAIAYFAINYSAFFGGQKLAQTAADAAALEAANQIAQVAVNAGPLGQVGLVDCPANAENHPAKNPLNAGEELRENQPVVGINTLLANIRLAALVSADVGTPFLADLARQDLLRVQELAQKINARVKDAIKPENSIWLASFNVYGQQNQRVAKGRPIREQYRLSIGALQRGVSNIKVIQGDNAETINGRYRAYIPISTAAGPVIFVAGADDARLVENHQFIPSLTVGGIEVAGSVVRVSAANLVESPANEGLGQGKHRATLLSVATATVGGGGAAPARSSTVLTMGFSGGMPHRNNFGGTISVASIMNYNKWQQGSKRTWFRANPSQGAVTPPAQLQATTPLTPAIEDPGKALARGVYSWIRTLGTRASRQSLVAALSSDLPAMFGGNGLCPNTRPLTACVLNVNSTVNDDARYQSIINGGPNFQNAYLMAFGYTWANQVCPNNAAFASYNPDTETWTQPNGRALTESCDFQNELVQTMAAGAYAKEAGLKARPLCDPHIQHWTQVAAAALAAQNYTLYAYAIKMRDSWRTAKDRAGAVHYNGHNKAGESYCAIFNYGALSACGIRKVGNQRWQFDRVQQQIITTPFLDVTPSGPDFGPDCDAAAAEAKAPQLAPFIIDFGSQPLSNTTGFNFTGFKNLLRNGTSQDWDYITQGSPEPGRMTVNHWIHGLNPPNNGPSGGNYSAPPVPADLAAANSSVVFHYICRGDYQNAIAEKGEISIQARNPATQTSPTYAFANNTLNRGAYLYVATNSLQTGASQRTFWSVIARNQVADLDPSLGNSLVAQPPINWCHSSGLSGTRINGNGPSQLGNGTEECPPEAFHFRIGCPLVEPPCASCCTTGAGVTGGNAFCTVPYIPGGLF